MSAAPANEEMRLRDELEQTRAKLEDLRARLREPEEIIRAIREGEIDALVVNDSRGEKVYSLRNADVLYRCMVERMQEGAIALDRSGLIVYANAHFATMMKTARTALVGASVFSLVPAESRSFFEPLAQPADETWRSDLMLRASDGTLVPIQATMNRIDLDEGDVFCLIVSDLTAERRREQLLAESRQKDEFLAMLAHELRNPIAPIRNAAQVIDMSGPREPRIRWATEVIERQVNQLNRLVDDLLDVSRVTRGKIRLDMRPVDLATVVARGVETAQPSIAARRHELSIAMPQGPLRAMGDSTRLSQVVSNILQNAAKFTSEKGNIRLSVAQRGDEARITVSDNGVGIRPEMLPKVFELFTQADASLERAQGGLGIGLALVRTLVELHGGRVEARSPGLGLGSEFSVSLPLLSTKANETSQSSTTTIAPPSSGRRRVLVVDDNVDAAQSIVFILEDLGHDVRMATDGSNVVTMAREFGPDLVLLDISLPDRSGFDIATELRGVPELAGVCLVALTGYGQDEHRRRSREAGFDHHWVKPIDLTELVHLLNSLAPSRRAAG